MEKTPVCYVDDNTSHLTLVKHAFANDYSITTFDNANGIIDQIAAVRPKLILLDVSMPDIDGYELCKSIRQHNDLSKVPVIFLSCMRDLADRLKGYEAGGDSFVTKPYDLQELRLVIEALLKRQEMYDRATTSSKQASEIAMDSMRNNSELGELIKFSRGVSKVRDEASFICSLFETLKAFGLDATLLVRLVSGEVVARTDGKPFTLMEKQLLELAHNAERVTEYGTKYLFNSKNAVLLIKNMPIEDEALLGRLKDHLATLIETAEACVELINADKQSQILLDSKTEKASETVSAEFASILEITDQLFMSLSRDFESLCENLERSFIYLDLTEEQEEQIMTHIEHARRDVDKQHLLRDQLQTAMVRISDSVGLLKDRN